MPNLPVPNIPKGVTESNDRLLAVKDDDSLSLLPYAEDQLAQDASIAANAEAIKALDALTDGGVEEAPVDGLQYARQDEGWVEVAGSDFDGEHVLIGDPAAPPDGLDVGQLLWDGVEGSSGGSGGGGPHDHVEYALVEHDHDEFTHDHDYLPLAGGTLTGGLTVEDRLTLASETSNPLMLVNRGETRVGYFGVPGAQAGIDGELHLRSDKALMLQGIDGVRVLQSDLTVDGAAWVGHGKAVYFGGNWEGGRIYNSGSGTREYMVLGSGTVGAQINLYGMNDDLSKGNILFYAGEAEGGGSRTVGRWDGPTGAFMAYRDAEVRGDLRVDGIFTPAGGTTFGITEGIDTADVLERAETATMPALDDEGVATADAEGVMLNDVVTALLLKVKELSAEIEELKGA